MQVIEKPWGKEEILELNGIYLVKRLTMHKGHKCSIQYHKKKKETVYVLEGILKIYVGQDAKSLKTITLKKDDFITVLPGIVHRMEAVENSIYLESSTPELDDVVRIQDEYGRK